MAEEEAARHLSRQGPNELPAAPPPSPWNIFAGQFASLIVWVLIGAAITSGLLGEWIDTGAILAIVLLNGCLGFFQEYRAGQSLARLKTLAVTHARVLRDGARRIVPSRELVPGDILKWKQEIVSRLTRASAMPQPCGRKRRR
ncbi:MAG TPA: cation-transporting P-type ATPase [Nitrospira sp.]